MQGICLDYTSAPSMEPMQRWGRNALSFKGEEKTVKSDLKEKKNVGEAKEIKKWKKEKRKMMADVLGIERSLKNKIYANAKYLSLHLLLS